VDPSRWILLTLGAAVAVGFSVWWYRTREEPVAGRAWAAGLRTFTMILAWLILLNPLVPGRYGPGGDADVAFLDASYSMSRPAGALGTAAWQVAIDSVRRFEGVWAFGEEVPRYLSADSLPASPIYGESRLAPALRAAALSGARRGVVFTDGEIGDASEALDVARRNRIELALVVIDAPSPDMAIAELEASSWVQAGDSVQVRADVVSFARGLDSVRVEVVDEDDRLRGAQWIPVPEAGRYSTARFAFPVGDRAGHRRYAVRLAAGPGAAELDPRPFHVRVTERPAGPVLISLRPDWEPSFLVASLDRLTDAPTSSYLWLADSLVTLEGYRPVSLAAVERRAGAAPLLVLHGYGADAPEWARDLVRRAERLLLFPAGSAAIDLPGWTVSISSPLSGEWYASSELPPSPFALDLSGLPEDYLAPLLRARTVEAERAWGPLNLLRMRRGDPLPALAAGSAGPRRWAVASAEGYWRWAFRRGAGRQLYRSLWSGVAGWLLEGRATAGTGIEPLESVVSFDRPLRWNVPPVTDSLVVEISGADTLIRVAAAAPDPLEVRLEAGSYRYIARAYRSDDLVASAAGPVEVERFVPELLPRAKVTLVQRLDFANDPNAGDLGRRQRRLATLGWPYLLLILLFCSEWAVRRFIGLR
jgi:hypothetical protein